MAAPSSPFHTTFIGVLLVGSMAAARVGLVASGRSASLEAGVSAFTVSEATARDLNGDGDALDAVVHVADAKSGVTLNLGLAVSTVCRTTAGPPFVDCQPVAPVVARNVVAVLVGESAQGGLDLNGDGDAGDQLIYVGHRDEVKP